MIRTSQMIHAPVVDNKDLWETPDHIFYPLDEKFRFTLDPCCVKETAKCPLYYTPEINGLKQDWRGETVFCNPPYSRDNIDEWVFKCYTESLGANVVALLPVSTSSTWFQLWILPQTIYWIDKRVRFKNAPHTSPFSSMIVHFNHESKNLTWKQ